MRIFFWFIGVSWIIISCSRTEKPDLLFTLMDPDDTGVRFENTIVETVQQNMILKEYTFNGAGVAVGDINNDGLPDLFFGGNQVSSRMYLNEGGLKFKDITGNAGLTTNGWVTGVNMVDINQDGFLDIYVCLANKQMTGFKKNLLFINQGDLTFKESARACGLDDGADATHSVFFDYDRDGDLDMYLVNHTFENRNPTQLIPRRLKGEAPNTDMLFRNDGPVQNDSGLPIFTDVSEEAGISIEGYGLGVAVSDFNLDGWPDIYVANDYLSNDILYRNNKNGTFTNVIGEWMGHQSASSMGCDVADFNNDGLVDVFTLDMFAEDNYRQKMMFSQIFHNRRHMELENGYEPQYTRNMLQTHRGFNADGEPYFSEIGQLAGISQTDWSWSALFADFDNDGMKDLFISNGLPKDITNLDLISLRQKLMSSRGQTLNSFMDRAGQFIDSIQSLSRENYIFRNNGDMTFEDKSLDWGIGVQGYSNGAIYADLDLDGDLEIVTNNINGPCFIYRNNLIRESHPVPDSSRYLRIRFTDPDNLAYHAKVTLYAGNAFQFQELQPSRGYKSSSARILHFGLGSCPPVDSVVIDWIDGARQIVYDPPSNETLRISYDPSENRKSWPLKSSDHRLFSVVTEEVKVDYRHIEKYYNDFQVTPLLIHRYSQLGPGVAVGDVNGDGMEDFYIGGSYQYSGRLFFQREDGTFSGKNLVRGEKNEEDLGTLLFDSDNDGDLDLYIVSGSSEFGPESEYYSDRLYINDGKGNFVPGEGKIPVLNISGSCIEAADFDNDGDLDLFRGGRLAYTRYPLPVSSTIMLNEQGTFKDITESVCPSLKKIGLVTDALWSDVNNDHWPDLIIVGEWMPLTVFINDKGRLKPGFESLEVGWWNSITGGDFDNDGDTDLVSGNFGLNSRYKASPSHPVVIDAGDFNNDNIIDGIVSQYVKNDDQGYELYPVPFLADLGRQLPFFQRVFRNFSEYAMTNTPRLIELGNLKPIYHAESNEFASMFWENNGDGTFTPSELPVECQYAPLFGMITGDFNQDPWLDIISGGNFFSTEALTGRYDAFYGGMLKGNRDNSFQFVPEKNSGVYLPGDVKGMATLYMGSDVFHIVVTRNNGRADILRKNGGQQEEVRLFQPEKYDRYAEMYFKNGTKRKVEFYFGSTYLSNSSRSFHVPDDVDSLVIYDYKSRKRKIDPD